MYVLLFYINCIEKDLYIAIKVKITEPDKNYHFRSFQMELFRVAFSHLCNNHAV